MGRPDFGTNIEGVVSGERAGLYRPSRMDPMSASTKVQGLANHGAGLSPGSGKRDLFGPLVRAVLIQGDAHRLLIVRGDEKPGIQGFPAGTPEIDLAAPDPNPMSAGQQLEPHHHINGIGASIWLFDGSRFRREALSCKARAAEQ